MKSNLDEKLICEEYLNTKIGIEKMALKYHVGKKKIKDILTNNNINSKKRGGQNNNEVFMVKNPKIKKYINTDEYYYEVIDKNNDFHSLDINNKAGVLTSYIKKEYDIEIPTLYDRDKYYMQTGNYWWEQFLTYRKNNRKEVKKCPYCSWETLDVENKSGMFETHLRKQHNIDKLTYLKEHPEDRDYFRLANPQADLQMETDTDKFVTCKICGKKLTKISNAHLQTHGITKDEYISLYGDKNIMCKNTYNKFVKIADKLNTCLSEKTKDRFTSNAEKEIIQFLAKHGVKSYKDRSILHGHELDIYIPDKQIAIEYNGNLWHTEGFGKKDRNYHITKLNLCNEKGIKLIQICDDEYIEHKELVLNKISHIVGVDIDKPKIYARKTKIKQIFTFEAEEFLEKYHIQGKTRATVHYGCYYNDKLIAVMSFKNGSIKNKGWELTRFASDYNYVCCGVGGKLFKHFLKEYNPEKVFSFADRRWTVSVNDNIYTKLGYNIETILKPDYKYFKLRCHNNSRIHKMSLNKKLLAKNYGLDIRLTESEMTRQLGYDRIWDCGLIKYVYKNPNYLYNKDENE